jgi:surface antigen
MKRWFNNLIIFLLAAGLLNTLVLPVYAADTYPYPSDPTCPSNCTPDPWAFYKRECTSYAAWKANESGTSFSNHMVGPNGSSGTFGNGGNWDNNAVSIGFIVDNTSSVGSIAVWDPSGSGTLSVGHVAWVESINQNNTPNISEYNYSIPHGYSIRNSPTPAPNHYIHLSGLCGGSNVTIQGQTIVGNFSCKATNSITILPNTLIQQGANARFYIQ